MLEKRIERHVVDYAKRRGITSVKLNITGNRGYPDRMFMVPGGKPVFIEFKRPGGHVRKLQTIVMDLLQQKGYHVYVVDSVLDGEQVIDGYC